MVNIRRSQQFWVALEYFIQHSSINNVTYGTNQVSLSLLLFDDKNNGVELHIVKE